MSLTGDVAGVAAGLINNGRSIPTPDLTKLFETIKNAGANQRNLINALPAELQKQYEAYASSNTAASDALKTDTSAIGDALVKQTEANYGPEATKAALDAVKGDIYAELPGQQDAVREALAATGGFDRGTAGKQLAAPVLQAAQKYASAAAGITAQQLQAKQAATQQALNTVTNMNDQALQATFGMSREQALQILNGNRQDLKDQLTQLITQSNNETNQTLGVEGDVAMSNYRQAMADTARKDALTNSEAKLGADAISQGLSYAIGAPGASGATGFDPATMSNGPMSYDQLMAL